MPATETPLRTQDEISFDSIRTLHTGPTRVLLGEDDVQMRSLLAWCLREAGYEVDEAESGSDLLERLAPSLQEARLTGKPVEFDIVLTDVCMPGMSGLDVLAGFRKYDTLTPFILITGFGDPETHERAYALGASAVIDKPFDIDALGTVLRRLLPP